MVIEEILKKNSIAVEKETSSSYVVRCFNPTHTDSNPSMHVNKHTGVFHCFSCKHKGNIFQKFGLEQPNEYATRSSKCLSIIQELKSDPNLDFPVDYELCDFSYRGITAQTISRYEMFTSDILKNRFVFPIYDILKNRTVFHGRLIDSTDTNGPKYLFHPRHKKIPIFPLYELDSTDPTVIIVEGIFDLLSLKDIDIQNCITIFGVSNFTEDSLDTLKILGTKKIICLLDNDKAGEEASLSIKRICDKKYVEYYRPQEFPEGYKDVAEMPRDIRKEFISNCYENSFYRSQTE